MFHESVAPPGRKVDVMQTQKIVIHSLDELVEVFPSLTENQIIFLFRRCTYELQRTNRLLGSCRNELLRDALLERVSAYLPISDFLSGYLAKAYCKRLGLDLF